MFMEDFNYWRGKKVIEELALNVSGRLLSLEKAKVEAEVEAEAEERGEDDGNERFSDRYIDLFYQ